MNGTVFADTSGFFAVSAAENERHEPALAFLSRASRLVTTRFVVLETISLITKRISPLDARLWHEKFVGSRAVEVREFDEELYGKAERFWRKRPDKTWDLIDCYSFGVMHRERIEQALTLDRHFRQAGFTARRSRNQRCSGASAKRRGRDALHRSAATT
ncbi:MAG: PIN domain-containing protein, partial [Verrucomicrobia bacterium]|nr:PIN domain-containing protein [Verrucomicrobiota bacterium]